MIHRYLVHFKAVAETGSVSAAAENLYISQPSLSRSIKLLEDEIGFLLFERKKRRVFLTEYGKSLYSHICFMEQEFDYAMADLNYIQSKQLRSLHIGCGIVWQYCTIPYILKEYQETHKNIRLEISRGHSRTLYEKFQAGRYDLILCDLDELHEMEGIVFDKILDVNFTFFARKNHPIFKKGLKMEEHTLKEYGFALFNHSESEYASPIEDPKMLSNLNRNQIKFTTTSIGNLFTTISNTDYIAPIPLQLYEIAEIHGVHEISPQFRRSSFPSGAVYKASSVRKESISDLIVLLKKRAKHFQDL